ncbi:uncharacterized protein EDB93DRAFT_1108892 [Suillus bovinus]|uniref:uncharacterized protein n=1 Tax=Suillus bovinus TaxID=48563 RepID=UPI001B86C4DA|nr:uncharacterized protein EDB93DRAFT_1108892 [Suillus bovinus]KAG2128903.1 hypothetical protein EDB93DRAFT_1108892 [Suillus bovinus]
MAALHVYSDHDQTPASVQHPKWVVMPSAKVISADNTADLKLHSHRKAHGAANAVPQVPTPITNFDEDESDLKLICSKPRWLTKGAEPDAVLNEVGPSTTISNAPQVAPTSNNLDADSFLKDLEIMDINEPKTKNCAKNSKKYQNCEIFRQALIYLTHPALQLTT